MDDLLGEDWQAPSKPSTSIPTNTLNPSSYASNYSSFRSSPAPQLSGTASPQNISRPSSTLNGGAKAPTGDSFGNLLSLKSQKQSTNVSILERQRQIAEEKRKQQEAQSQLWDNLGSGRATPESRGLSPVGLSQTPSEDVDDILAAFNKSAPVNKASHFPPPSSGPISRGGTPALAQPVESFRVDDNDDDDPFGLGSMPQKRTEPASSHRSKAVHDDDDILGDLGKPMIEPVPRDRMSRPAASLNDGFSAPLQEQLSSSPPVSNALSELVEMGFASDVAQIALAENDGDLQNAVGWLLKQAHQESQAKAQNEAGERRGQPGRSTSPPRRHQEEDAMPSWMRQERQRQDNRSPVGRDKDPSQMAQEFGSKFLKGANSLWKASQKQMSKTMSEFQQEREPNQPKWMQESGRASSKSRSGRNFDVEVTNEAAMLDMPRDRPVKPSRYSEQEVFDRRPVEPLPHRPSPQARFMPEPPVTQDKRPATKLSRQDVEEQTAQAYVSPARRRRTTPKPEPKPEPEVDLFSSAPPASSRPSPAVANGTSAISPRARSSPAPPKPTIPPRNVPAVAVTVLATSAAHRKLGGEAFKRGDYASAHEAYCAALAPLPSTHPVTIIVLSNRSLTALKTGDAKTAVADADQALGIIGPGQGVGETIEAGSGEAPKDMREFYGKALMRKAEALEHLEKWSDAAAVWRQAIEAGVGGAVALRSRDRCDKAAAPKPPAPKVAPSQKPVSRAPPAKSTAVPASRKIVSNVAPDEAVKKLREANAAAEKADDEKFRLADQVDGKLNAWKAGKADNLRALLQSMDIVLWPEAGWKKVGMSDLVMPNKVKIFYMKAIAKVHPDKISQDATTEQRMISGAVFSTLNEAWDKFKKDNNL